MFSESATSYTSVGYSEVGTTFISNSVYANCVPDSEATQIRRTVNLTHGPSAILRSFNVNIALLIPDEVRQLCASHASREETLWLAKLAKSLHEETADGSSGFIGAAITKPRSALEM